MGSAGEFASVLLAGAPQRERSLALSAVSPFAVSSRVVLPGLYRERGAGDVPILVRLLSQGVPPVLESMTRIGWGFGLHLGSRRSDTEGFRRRRGLAPRLSRPTLWPLRPPQSSLRPAVRAAASYQISRRSFWGSPRETPSAPGSTTWRRGQRGTRAGRPT